MSDWKEREKQRIIPLFEDAVVDQRGVIRWKSNDAVPPSDILGIWAEAGLSFDLSASVSQRRLDTIEFMNRYREAQALRTPEQIAEQQLEMRAAFGPGVKVVNVITGERTET